MYIHTYTHAHKVAMHPGYIHHSPWTQKQGCGSALKGGSDSENTRPHHIHTYTYTHIKLLCIWAIFTIALVHKSRAAALSWRGSLTLSTSTYVYIHTHKVAMHLGYIHHSPCTQAEGCGSALEGGSDSVHAAEA
jgi:hypothetical protein